MLDLYGLTLPPDLIIEVRGANWLIDVVRDDGRLGHLVNLVNPV